MEKELHALFERYAHFFLREAGDVPRFRAATEGPWVTITTESGASFRGRISAYLLLCARFWAYVHPHAGGRFKALAPCLTKQPTVDSPWKYWVGFHGDDDGSRDVLLDFAEAATAVTTHDEGALLWRSLLRRDEDWEARWNDYARRDAVKRISARVRKAVQRPPPCVAELDSEKSYSPNTVAKTIAPFASSKDELVRLGVAVNLSEVASSVYFGDPILYLKAATPAIGPLLAEKDGAAFEVALGFNQKLAAILIAHRRYDAAQPLLDRLLEEQVGLPETLRMRWECRLFAGDPRAEDDWTESELVDDPTRPILRSDPNDSAPNESRRRTARDRVVKALIDIAEGRDPGNARGAAKKPKSVAPARRSELLARAEKLQALE